VSDDFRLPSRQELAVLELLAARDEMYALEMVEASPALKRGTVYVLLGRMADKGYVASRQVKEKGASGVPKRLYRVTALGQRTLQAWRQAQASFAGALMQAK
jgi:PadR family transcriptional regulator, regulatory protein PadR